MDSAEGAQYAIQIAVHTLRDRCKNLQQHVALLEEENVNLRIKCSQHEESKNSLDELDCLRAQVAKLSEQKDQLQNKVKIVTNENQDLWRKLSRLTRVNKTLGSQLSEINDTLTQHAERVPINPSPHHNLIRSKTFTKSELQTKVLQKNLEENDKISLELEDISLKLSDSFSKQKKELEMLCLEISEMTFNEELNCAFLLDEELENDVFIDIQAFGEELRILRDTVGHQRTLLELNVKNMQSLKDKLETKSYQCHKPKKDVGTLTINNSFENKCTDTEDLNLTKQSSPSRKSNFVEQNDRVCPLCSKVFRKEIDFIIFEQHVEEHFVPDGYEML